MTRFFCALLLACAPAALAAQDWTLRQGRIPLSYGDLQDLGNGLGRKTGSGGSHIGFGPKASHRHAPWQGMSIGSLQLRRDGRVCIGGSDSGRDCGVYMRGGELRFRLGETKGRTPFRLELGLRQ